MMSNIKADPLGVSLCSTKSAMNIEPIYPQAVPVPGEYGIRFVFVRSVAIYVLDMLQEDESEEEQLDYSTMDNVELEEALLANGAIHESFFGGVVDDGQPNGFIKVIQPFR